MDEPKVVLVVEDEWLIAVALSDMLADRGLSVLGPVSTKAAALALLEKSEPDCALLDISLRGEKSFEIGDALTARGIPFAYLTGYLAGDLPPACRAAPILAKPISNADLARILPGLFGGDFPAKSEVHQ